ncbi:UvrD-helicase domain-containing protein [Paenibacillus dakarensis]|uniref:UvrD-helicase domain-containing protein n=1 Tax=Paenibacillus dakarensis TaxID=1527293 RepID=UPI0006D57377|nr:UvrD-helicase domain-containing protein [Paenibacillus dakarensis]
MLITKDFLKDIPPEKKSFVLGKMEAFNHALMDCFRMNNLPHGFWVRKVVGTDIYKFRVNNGDRVLFTLKEERGEKNILFLRYCNHDEQIRRAKVQNRTLGSIQIADFDPVIADYEENELDAELTSEYDEYAKKHAYLSLSQLASIVLEDEYIALLLDEDNDDYLYYLNDDQYDCLKVLDKPLLVSGSAGSGKSMIGIRKLLLNQLAGIRTAYVTNSNILKEHMSSLFDKFKDSNTTEDVVDFTTLNEYCLSRLSLSPKQVVQYADFEKWYRSASRLEKRKPLDVLMVWFEISSVIKGSNESLVEPSGFLKETVYLAKSKLALTTAEKSRIYHIAKRYHQWLEKNQLVDENDLARMCLEQRQTQPADLAYDFVVMDEVQDMSEVQFALLITLAKRKEHYMVLGDVNQNIHIGWTAINHLKSLFFQSCGEFEERNLIKNYRNSSEIVELVNKLSDLREQHIGRNAYDIRESFIRTGNRPLLVQYSQEDRKRLFEQMNERDYCAIVVAHADERDKLQLEGYPTDRIFTIHEIKGLEYKTVLLVNVMSAYAGYWETILNGCAKGNDFYRFFFNLVYVAATRARDQLCIVEDNSFNSLLQELQPYLETVSRFDLAQLQLESETTIQSWKKEAQRLEKAELYKKALDIYHRLGDHEGEERCQNHLKALSVHYWDDMLGVRNETAIRIERENGALSSNDVYQALIHFSLRHSISFDVNERIHVVVQSKDGTSGQTADIKMMNKGDILQECSSAAYEMMALQGMKNNKVTIHTKLISEGRNVLITDLEGTGYDTVIMEYTRKGLTFQYTNTKEQSINRMLDEMLPDAFESFQKNETLHNEALMRKHLHKANDLSDSGHYALAIEEYETAFTLTHPNNSEMLSAISSSIGYCFLQKEDYRNAELYLKKAVSWKAPTIFEAYNSLGVIKLRQGEFPEAAAFFRKAIACHPAYQVAKSNLQLAMSMMREEERESQHWRSLPAMNGKSAGRNDPCPCGSGKKYKKCCM